MKIGNRQIRRIGNSLSMSFANRWVFFAPIPSDGEIRFFSRDRKDFYFLSNFHSVPLLIDGETWPHVEAYYQGQKSPNPAYRAELLKKAHPSWSKFVGDSRIGHHQLVRIT